MTPRQTQIDEEHRRWSRLIAPLRLAVVLATIAVGILLTQHASRRQILVNLQARGESSAGFVSTFLSEQAEREIHTGRSLLSGRRTTSSGFGVVVASFGSPAAVLLNRSGRLLQVVPRDPAIIGTDLGSRYAHLRAAEAGHVAVSGVVLSAADHKPIIAIAVPYHTRAGRRVLSIAYPVAQTALADLVRLTTLSTPHRVMLVDAQGNIIAGNPSPSGSTLKRANPQLAAAVSHAPQGNVRIAGLAARYVSVAVPGTSWHLVIAIADAKLFSAINGSALWLPWSVFAVLSLFGILAVALFARSQSTGRRLASVSRELAQAALVDPVTGLLNRRALENSLVQSIARTRRAQEPLSALMIDLDHFKQINDTHGHETGDQVLRVIADSMREVFRDSDIVGRWGGDEFLVLLPDTNSEGAHDASRRLRDHVNATSMLPHAASQLVTLSVGAATSTTGDDLIRQADIALYRAKHARSPKVVATTPTTAAEDPPAADERGDPHAGQDQGCAA
jgi:diguanylate cyclase (GGDEF)-like protein